MSKVFEGQLSAAGLRFAIVVSRFNSFIVERLVDGALMLDLIAKYAPDAGPLERSRVDLADICDELIAEIEKFAPSQLEISDRDGDGHPGRICIARQRQHRH